MPADLAEKVEEECGTYEGALKFIDFKIAKLNDKRKTDAELKDWARNMKGNVKTPYTAAILDGDEHRAEPPPPAPQITAEQIGA